MVMIARQEYREGRRFILCDLIHDARLLLTPMVVLDVGARDAFGNMPWTALPADMVRLHGFEPDPQECNALNGKAQAGGLDFHFHPIALAERTGPIDFYRYAEPAANSFYPANRRLVERFCYGRELTLASQFEVIERGAIEAKSVADWAHEAGVARIDFCKLNVQGAELDILRGAQPLLDSMLGIVAEQTFNATYLGAPLFGEVYDFIRGAGFSLFDVTGMNLVARTRSPIHVTDDRVFSVKGTWPRHQFLEGHFLYFRDPILAADIWTSGSASLEQCIKLACIAEMFGQIEYAFELLSWIAASPETGENGCLCREIAKRGAEVYLSVSQPSAEEVPAGGSLEIENTRLATELAAQFAQTARLEAGLSDWASAARRLQGELAAQSDQVTRLHGELAAQSNQVTRLEAGLATWMTEAARLRAEQELSRHQAESVQAGWAAERERLQAEFSRMQARLSGMYSSTSWRITKPLRNLSEFARRTWARWARSRNL